MNTRTIPRKRVVLTRSKDGNRELAPRIRAMGIEPISVDTIDLIDPHDWGSIDRSLRRLGGFDWLVFTSANGVKMFERRAGALKLEVPWKGNPLVAAVGDATARELRRLEIKVAFVPSEFLTSRLAEELPEAGTDESVGRVLLLRADIADPQMVKSLRLRGFDVIEHAIYRTAVHKATAVPDLRGVDAVLFASPSAVEGFTSALSPERLRATKETLAVCIGPVTAVAAREHGFERTATSKLHTFDGLLRQLERELTLERKADA